MRKIRILNIVPDIYTEGIAVSVKDRQALAAALKEETGGLVELESRIVEGGSESIECFYDSALAAPYILKLVQQGEKDGFDAIVLDCFLDPALSECRESVSYTHLVRCPAISPYLMVGLTKRDIPLSIVGISCKRMVEIFLWILVFIRTTLSMAKLGRTVRRRAAINLFWMR